MEQQAAYKVSWTDKPPAFDSVPVAKIIDYPLEKRDYRPFAQCILCVGAGRLYLRMWAFEVSPMPGSALACVLYPYPDKPSLAVEFRFEHGEGDTVAVSVFPMEDGVRVDPIPDPALRKLLSDTVELHPHNGEDLQGAYWGMTLSLPLTTLEAMGRGPVLAPGTTVPGNFYKTCDHERFTHKGALFPADFTGNPYTAAGMGGFQVVSY